MNTTRFSPPTGRLRVAGCFAATYPDAGEAEHYAEFARLAAALDAETQFPHSVMPDPRTLPAAMKGLIGSGLFVPDFPPLCRNDVEHARSSMSLPFARLMALLCERTGATEQQLLAEVEWPLALSHVRWLRAWHVDAIVSWNAQQSTLWAAAVSFMLGVPHVMCLPAPFEDSLYAYVVPTIARHALTIVAEPAVAGRLAAAAGDEVRAKVLPRAELASAAHVSTIRRAIASRPPDAPPRGAFPAFVTRRATPPARPAGTRAFVVVGAERTGTNLLVDLLSQQPGIACAGEIFNHRLVSEGLLPWFTFDEPAAPGLLQLRIDDPVALHARLVADGHARGLAWVGFKLLYFHGAVDDRVVDAIAADPDARIVHITRKDRLRRWVSHCQAAVTDHWATAVGAPRRTSPPVELDVARTLADFALVELMEERCRATFARHVQLELEYESFATNLAVTAARVAQLFGVPAAPVEARTQKTGGTPLADSIVNFAEVRDALTGTRWAHLLGE